MTNRENAKKFEKGITEIKSLKSYTHELLGDINYQISKLKQEREGLEEEINQFRKTKAELLNYTLGIITIIVALLGVILTITFLTLKFYTPEGNFLWFCIFMILFLTAIFVSWFVAWIKKEEIFKFDGIERNKKPDKQCPKSMSNWFILSILVFMIIIFITFNIVFSISAPIYWFISLLFIGIFLILSTIFRSSGESKIKDHI